MPKRSCTPDGRMICVTGHIVAPSVMVYTINPIGGYGMDEVLCCEDGIVKPENAGFRERMIEAGASELEHH